MTQHSDLESVREQLNHVDYGEYGLTRNELKERVAALPDTIYLHLPDSKRFRNADDVLHEARTAAARAEGEFIAADDNMPSDGAEADYGPAAYGDSPLVSPSVSGPSANTPLPGFDGNSLETEREYQ